MSLFYVHMISAFVVFVIATSLSFALTGKFQPVLFYFLVGLILIQFMDLDHKGNLKDLIVCGLKLNNEEFIEDNCPERIVSRGFMHKPEIFLVLLGLMVGWLVHMRLDGIL